MKFYLQLQWKRIIRMIQESGFHPIAALAIIAILSIISFEVIYSQVIHGIKIIIALGIFSVIKLSEPTRNAFLQTAFKKKEYRQIRLVENVIVILPFLLFTIYKLEWIPSLFLFILAFSLSFFIQRGQWNWAIPTPFHKKPFEFIVGFRRTWVIILLSYVLGIFGLYIDNGNLAIFGLIVLFLVMMMFYSESEPELYVWNSSLTPKGFLKQKALTGILQASILTVPMLVMLSVFHSDKILVLLAIQILGLAQIINVIFGKYAYFPSQMNIAQGLLTVMSLIIPPFLLFLIPRFYIQAHTNLKRLLK